MSVLFTWIPSDKEHPTRQVIVSMGAALRSRPEERHKRWTEPGFGIGQLEAPSIASSSGVLWTPVEQGPLKAWMVGEVFCDQREDDNNATVTDTQQLRKQILAEVLSNGVDVARQLDGEFCIARWDGRDRVLEIANDRFGGLPLYLGESKEGVAIAGGVRGVLMAPGIDSTPDPDAIREAVTFGGFRLGARTNVASVHMLSGGSVTTVVDGNVRRKRYWSYKDIPETPKRSVSDLIEQSRVLWTQAIKRRLGGAGRFGQTLSGGLDSRAILAEAAPQKDSWAAVSYGIPECDDVRYGRRAAAVAGANWLYYDIYRDPVPDWLTSRSQQIQRTDGLIDLFDLMHVESVTRQAELMDVHLSGYIGDAVCGPTFAAIESVEDVMAHLPFYGTLAMSYDEARGRAQTLVERLAGAPPRYALFENKLPQATNRWTAAWRPWLSVRKPFVDYALFDFWLGLPVDVRLKANLYEHFLSQHYPDFFGRIPNQKTGVPVLTPPWRHQLARVARFAWRKCAPLVGITPNARHYHDVSRQWTTPEARRRIEDTVLRQGSLSADLMGRGPLKQFLAGWFDEGNGPTQVVAALYVYEHYHRDLASHLSAARRA